MQKDSKIDLVSVNDVVLAVRITFTAHNKFFARQYAVSDEFTVEEALKAAEKYCDRIVNRVVENDVPAMTPMQIKDMQRQIERSKQMRLKAKAAVAHAIAVYRITEEQPLYGYVNVFGQEVSKNAPFN